MQQLRDARFGYVLKHAQYALRQAMDDRLTEANLTTPQYAALTALEREEGLSNAELARRCFVTPQTMHSIVTRLEEDDLLRRTPHPNHGRIRQLHLTDEGQARLERAHEIVNEIEDTMTREVSREEVKQATDVLITCAAALQEE
ncbi:MAG: MarR family winged helix-turn-helix transcriptional regulator [Salinibacter sp.]